MPVLHKYGYHFASTHVHPMATDGEDEFLMLSGSAPAIELREVLENAILIHTMILQEGLNRSARLWMRVMYDFIDAARRGIVEETQYREILMKIHSTGPEFRLSQPLPVT
jgi:hypothetical protein